MTLDELQTIIDSTKWIFLGQGGYNTVTVSADNLTIDGFFGKWILKQPLFKHSLSESSRAVRKWNTLNPDYPALTTINGWMAPYLGDTPASDEQISKKIIDIYRRTRNIIGDGAKKSNFRVHVDQIMCIDVDQAFRRGSFASDRYDAVNSIEHHIFLTDCARKGSPKTANVIATLLYLESHLSENDIDNKYLTENLIAKLHCFRDENKEITVELLDTLLNLVSLIPTGAIPDKYMTPNFVKKASPILKCQKIDPNTLFSLLNRHALECAIPRNIIKNGDLDEVRILIEHNSALLHQVDKDGFTLLHIAAMHGYTEVVGYLIDKGTDVNVVTPTAVGVYRKIIYPDMSALDLILSLECSDSVAILLLEKGADVSHAVNGQNHAIHVAAKNGKLEIVKTLIKRTPELMHIKDGLNQTPLLWAASRGHNETVKFLIDQGADVNIATQCPPNTDNPAFNNRSPLGWALAGGHIDTVLILRSAGAIDNYSSENRKAEPITKGLIQSSLFQSEPRCIDDERINEQQKLKIMSSIRHDF